MRIEIEEVGQLAIAPTTQLQRLQAGIQAALLLVQQAVEEENGGFQLLLRDLQHRGVRHGGDGSQGAASQSLAPLKGAVRGRVKVPTRNDLASHATLLSQLQQCVLHFDVQGPRQFIGEISPRGTIDERLGGGEQRAETREPDVGMRPQPLLVETGDFAQGIVSATMGVAGEIIQRLEFPEDRDIDRGSESLFQFAQGGDLAAQQKHTQFIGAKGEGSHNVIVPTVLFLLIGTITYPHSIRHDIGKTQETCFLGY